MSMSTRQRLVGVLVIAAAMGFWLGSTARAQEITATITGTVKDQSGSVVPGVEVHVRNLATNAEKKAFSNESGTYVVTLLPIGRYEVTAALTGFKKFVQGDIELHVNDRLRVDIILQTGQISDTITVVGGQQVIQTESSTISTLINGTQVTEMPLNGRNLIQLVALQPGVSSALPSTLTVGLGNLTSVSVNGSRASQNNWLVDGADNNDVGSNLALINYVNVDSVGEVNILRSNYNAEFGRSGGAQVSVVTKSGGNAFHGSVYEFLRNNIMDARNFFSFLDRDRDGKADAALLRYNNFGWTIGGPILKDKLFFFWGEEFRRIRTVRGNGVVITRVPTSAQRSGNFSELGTRIIAPNTGMPFPGDIIPNNQIDAFARALLDRFPLPNSDPAILGPGRNFSAAAPGVRNFREELIRVDYKLSPAHSIYGRFIKDTIPSTEPFGEIFGTNNAAFPGIANTATNNPGRSLVGTWTWIATPSLINEISYNYSRGAIFSEITGNAARNVAIPKVFRGAPGDALLPGISFGSSGYGGWDFFGPYDNTFGSHRIKETLSKNIQSHALKFGFLFSHEFKNENNASGTNGSFVFPGTSTTSYTSSGDAFADFLLGRASSYGETNIDITSHLRFKMWEAFVQDDWKIRPNLTLNMGVRWSYILQPTDTQNVLTNFDPEKFDRSRAYQITDTNVRVPRSGDPLNGLVIAGRNSPFGRRVVASHSNAFGPRFGFAWDPWSSGKTSVRSGYGIYFDRTLVGIALQNAFINPPFAFAAVFSAAPTAVPTLQNPQAGAQRDNDALVPNLLAMSPEFKIPTVQQWSLGVQQELPYKFNVEVAYVGSHGTHLLKPVGLNQTPPGTPAPFNRARPYPGFGNITFRATAASSRYDSMQISVGRRLTGGVQLNAAYTLSKSIADSASDRNAGDLPQDVRNQRAERALTTFDKRHIFVTNYIWELPFFRTSSSRLLYNVLGGWQISGITRFESGSPLTVTTSTNSANSFGGGALRPNLVGNPDGPRTIDEWFNRGAFVQPLTNTFGNAGRSLFTGPGLNLTDLTLMKNFKLSEQFRLQYRAEMFNVFNHTNLSGVGTTLGTPTYGRVQGAREPRLIQMGLKLTF